MINGLNTRALQGELKGRCFWIQGPRPWTLLPTTFRSLLDLKNVEVDKEAGPVVSGNKDK